MDVATPEVAEKLTPIASARSGGSGSAEAEVTDEPRASVHARVGDLELQLIVAVPSEENPPRTEIELPGAAGPGAPATPAADPEPDRGITRHNGPAGTGPGRGSSGADPPDVSAARSVQTREAQQASLPVPDRLAPGIGGRLFDPDPPGGGGLSIPNGLLLIGPGALLLIQPPVAVIALLLGLFALIGWASMRRVLLPYRPRQVR